MHWRVRCAASASVGHCVSTAPECSASALWKGVGVMRTCDFGLLLCRVMVAAFVLVGFGAMAAPALGQTVLHVDDDAGLGGDGSSWGSAFNNLQDALDAAAAAQAGLPGLNVVIKVAQGTYVPTKRVDENDPRSVTFQLRNNCTIAGGYAGIGAPDPDARDIELFESILSGDINGDDLPGFVNDGENAYHVLIGSNTDETAVLDGFTVAGGNANIDAGIEAAKHLGGGALTIAGTPLFNRCHFKRNRAEYGGALYNRQLDGISISECHFIENYAYWYGAAIRNYEAAAVIINSTFVSNNSANGATVACGGAAFVATCVVTSCEFLNNVAGGPGAAIQTTAAVIVTDSTFINNHSPIAAGAVQAQAGSTLTRCVFRNNRSVYVGGALNVNGTIASPVTIRDCEFTGNECTQFIGGAILGSNLQVLNCAFSNNSAPQGGAIYTVSGLVKIVGCSIAFNAGSGVFVDESGVSELLVHNSILWGNSTSQIESGIVGPPPPPNFTPIISVSYSNIQNGWPGDGNIDADPKFIQPGCDNLRLAHDSPCINAGSNALIPAGVTSDLDGNPRIQGGIVDMGAYEGGHDPLPPTACADYIEQGSFVRLIPTGGTYNPIESAAVTVVNENGPDGASASATQFFTPIHPTAGGFNQLGDALDVQTSIADGDVWMRIVIPFNQSNLNGFNWFDVDLTYFDTRINQWALAVAGNVNSSPGHSGPFGDRIITQGTGSDWGWTFDTGDYGIFWNPELQKGFVWANVDHATEFAFGVALPQCPGDCTYPVDDAVDRFDLLTVVGAWGLTPAGPPSFADFNRDGVVNVIDLLVVLDGWGACR